MWILVLITILQALTGSGAQVTGDVRLVDGDNNSTGRLEVYYRGEWNSVYNRYFHENDARVVCRQLGFEPNGIVHIFPSTFYGQGSAGSHVISTTWNCKGTEYNISECNTIRSTTTTHSYDVSMACSSTKIRLVGGDTQMSGRVELFLKGAWSSVCDSGFDNHDAKVVCSMLGYGDTGIAKAFPGSVYGVGTGDSQVSSLGCTGNEVDIVQCTASWGPGHCNHRRDAGVNCGATGIRLVNGATGREGRVEIYHAGSWGTICDRTSSFDRRNAMVICKMLGYNSSLAVGYTQAFYGEGHGPVIASNVQCDGSEKDIANCAQGTWHTSSSTSSLCPHSYDVGVNCAGVTKIRLSDGDSEQSGRVELFRNGHWGTLGSYDFDNHDLEVICRMMGYEYSSRSFFYKTPYYGTGVGEVVADNLQCDGMETDIAFCHGVRYWPGTSSHTHTSDVGVNCDGVLTMRVADGPTNGTGRLEIYHGGHWGTVCDYNFNRLDLIVACRTLGYPNIPESAYFHKAAYYGQGLGEIVAGNLQCNGVEENIGKCNGIWPASTNYQCRDHSNDVSVSCDGGFERIRLVNGTTSYEGSVQIFHDGKWWNICPQEFDRADAVVVCRELNMQQPEHARAFVRQEYGPGTTGSYLLSDLRCNGLEASLDMCKSSFKPSYYCSSNYRASVNCCPGCTGSAIIG